MVFQSLFLPEYACLFMQNKHKYQKMSYRLCHRRALYSFLWQMLRLIVCSNEEWNGCSWIFKANEYIRCTKNKPIKLNKASSFYYQLLLLIGCLIFIPGISLWSRECLHTKCSAAFCFIGQTLVYLVYVAMLTPIKICANLYKNLLASFGWKIYTSI